MEPTHNYFTAAQSRATVAAYTITHATSANTYINYASAVAIDGIGKYTYSAYIDNTSDANIRLGIRCLKVDGTWTSFSYSSYITAGTAGWASVTVDYSDGDVHAGTTLYARLAFNKARNTITTNPSIGTMMIERNDHRTEWILGGTSRAGDVCHDTSGYCNDGTINGATMLSQVSPRYKYCAVFDGTNAINAGTTAKMARDFTIAIWARCDTVQGRIWSSIQAGGTGIDVSSGWRARAYIDGGYKNLTSYKPDTLWHHYCMTYDGATLKYYIDGALHASSAQTLDVTYNATAPTWIGAEATTSATAHDGTNLFAGEMSDWRVYAIALSADEILELYNTSMSIDASGNVSARVLSQ